MSRFDAVGLFWEDYAKKPTDKSPGAAMRTRPLAPLPESTWAPPASFPELRDAPTLVVDVETYDPMLDQGKGPGDIRGDGHLVGIGVGVPNGPRWYFPMRHTVCPEHNMDPDSVLAWARDHLTRPGQLTVGANLLYDLFWLQAEGVHVPGPYLDVQWVEAIINETADSLSLDALGARYLGEHKTSDALYHWLARSYGGEPNGRQRKNIYRAPPQLVGPYAEGDVDLPWRVWEQQQPLVDQWQVSELVDLEHRLIPMLLAMRRQGVRVDADKAEHLDDLLLERGNRAQELLTDAAGMQVDVWAADSMAKAFDKAGVEYPLTPKAKRPSFAKEWLEACEHPMAEQILAVRRYEKARSTFVQGYVREAAIGGRVHPLFHPLRTDENGAISGRFASSNPNLQNVPARDPELGPLVRGLFLPDEGCRWRSGDYSQVEYRGLAHVARGPGSDAVRQRYKEDPRTDFHDEAAAQIKQVTRVVLSRKPTKNMNFGMVYGMGKGKVVRSLGVSEARGEELYEAYHRGAPYIRHTSRLAMDRAERRGYVRTLLGRIARFDSWEPRDWLLKEVIPASRDRDKVLAQVNQYIKTARAEGTHVPKPGVRRAYTHKSLNRVLQGSAADVIKKAMVLMWEAGCCDVVGPPLVQVHDQLDFNDAMTPEAAAAFEEISHLMETCVQLSVPLVVDWEVGPDWGSLSKL